jgi:hypothetical protein
MIEDDKVEYPNSLIVDKSKIFNTVDLTKRKTKIICTLG